MNGDDLDEYLKEADRRMKKNNGHVYTTVLKTRCAFCGRSPKQKGKCSQWFMTFIEKFKEVMAENGEVKL